MKKKLFWWIQQIDKLGGSEAVTIDLINNLCDVYDITLITTSRNDGGCLYDIDKRINIFSIGIPSEVTTCDQSFIKIRGFHPFKNIKLALRVFYWFFLKKHSIRKKIKAMVGDNVLICSEYDSYFLSPNHIKKIFHYNYNYSHFNSRPVRFGFSLIKKPDQYVVLSKETLNDMLNSKKKLGCPVSFIYNPCRFKPEFNFEYHNNSLIFVGRLCEQKNPLLALKVAKELRERKFKFKLNIYGDGPLFNEINIFIKENKLNGYVSLNSATKEIKTKFLESDLLLMTSNYEGFPLVKIEASSQSVPTIMGNFGDSTNEIIIDGVDGFIINSKDPKDYADKIIEVLSNKEKLKKLKETSYKRSFLWNIDSIKPQWVKLINSEFDKK
jgi:glycosyltransferase involved in cell wall biosynthesis